MHLKKLACLASTALVGSLVGVTGAYAQSTGSQTVEELVVTASRGAQTIDGTMIAETVSKTRSTITAEYIQTQASGQSALQLINGVPGVNFTNNDPYGSSGGNIRIRSFDGNRISLLWDGMPLNDSGNYAIFSNQLLDAENIERVQVNVGTTDVDSPTASAAGGTINYITRKPRDEFGLMLVGSLGSFSYNRLFAVVDSGEIGPWGTSAFLSVSRQSYDKFKGPGRLQKTQWNGRIYQPIGDNGDFVSVAYHYNVNRNAFYRNPTLAQFGSSAQGLEFGANALTFDNSPTCFRPAPAAGSPPQNEGAGASADCTNYFALRDNPSNTGNIRVSSSWHLAENVRVTVDPSFQYVLANGGGTSTVSESGTNSVTLMLLGNRFPTVTGFDLNGDGDTLDSVRFYTPNNTNTRRYGLNTSIIWDINDDNIIRVAYTYDRASHRQTGEWTYLDGAGNPASVFGGKDGHGPKVFGPDGSFMRQRDRKSIAMLNQIAVDYNGRFFDGAVRVNIGLRAPFMERQLNNFCYTNSAGFGYCSTALPTVTNADGTVQLPGQAGVNYLPPFRAVKKYNKVLPNIGATWDFAEHNTLYASFAEGFSAPRTDNLYNFSIPNVQPETTQAYDIGWRYHSGSTLAQVALWDTEYDNRIVSSFDQDLGINIDRNVGKVRIYGVDVSGSIEPVENLTLYVSGSYLHSEVKDNLVFGRVIQGGVSYPAFLPTAGKQLAETPEWTAFGRAQYKVAGFTFGFQGKYVASRFSTDVNDEQSPNYSVFDGDIRFDLGTLGLGKSWIQFNVTNIFDKRYLGSISSTNNAVTLVLPVVGSPTPATVQATGRAPTYAVGAPRTYQVSIRAAF